MLGWIYKKLRKGSFLLKDASAIENGLKDGQITQV